MANLIGLLEPKWSPIYAHPYPMNVNVSIKMGIAILIYKAHGQSELFHIDKE